MFLVPPLIVVFTSVNIFPFNQLKPQRGFSSTPGGVLSKEELESFHENGFLVVKGAVTHEHLFEMQERAEEIVDEFAQNFSGTASVFSTDDQVLYIYIYISSSRVGDGCRN